MIIGCVYYLRYLPVGLSLSYHPMYFQTGRHTLVSVQCLRGPIRPDLSLYHSEGGFFKARLSFPEDFPLNPPKMRFITPMWHPNSCVSLVVDCMPWLTHRSLTVYADGSVCISILVGYSLINLNLSFTHTHSIRRAMISMDTRILEKGGCLCTPSSQS